jgi:gamma-glutamylcyclotransferase (GGCT)/AIG2-like uncharacterized protein YtfP
MALTISKTEPTAYFVYGTLRDEAGAWGRPGYVEPPVTGCTAKGTLYNYGYAYPYADCDGDGEIKGDIITVDPEMARHIARVEMGAGYEAREVTVTLPSGESRVVIGWHITDTTKARMLRYGQIEVIPSGDWLACIAEEGRRYSRRRVYAD